VLPKVIFVWARSVHGGLLWWFALVDMIGLPKVVHSSFSWGSVVKRMAMRWWVPVISLGASGAAGSSHVVGVPLSLVISCFVVVGMSDIQSFICSQLAAMVISPCCQGRCFMDMSFLMACGLLGSQPSPQTVSVG